MDAKSIGILAAQLAASAASIAVSIFLPGVGLIVAAAIELTVNTIIASIEGALFGDTIGAITSVMMGVVSAIPTSELITPLTKALSKIAPNATKTINKLTIDVQRFTSKITAKIEKFAPDKLLDNALKKWTNFDKTSQLQDNQLILRKQAELDNYGEIRTKNKINSTKFNPNINSWIKLAHFEETRFIDRNNIIGKLTIMYYQNNDSRLFKRKEMSLNGNHGIVAITINNARYKNDYVSGICRAKSWGAYYMRTWMIGKPGRGLEGINTSFWFGNTWRIDNKIQNLFNQYKNFDKVLQNYAEDVAMKFLGKTKIGTKLMSFKDVYTKSYTNLTNIKNGKATFLKRPLKELKKKQSK